MSEAIQQIEKDYINSMLDIDQFDVSQAVVQHENIVHAEAFKQAEIPCQVFSIAGLNIAVPTCSIREIIEPPVSINTDHNSRPCMCAGTINHNAENIDLIDIEYLIMNKGSDHVQTATGVVLLKGCSTGFIYEQAPAGHNITSQQIHWRDTTSQRLWLAGTIAQSALALLDIDGLLKLFQSQN